MPSIPKSIINIQLLPYKIPLPIRLNRNIPFGTIISTLLPKTPRDAGRCLVCWYLFAVQPSLDVLVAEYIPGPILGTRHTLDSARILVSALVATVRPYLEMAAEEYFSLDPEPTRVGSIVPPLSTPNSTAHQVPFTSDRAAAAAARFNHQRILTAPDASILLLYRCIFVCASLNLCSLFLLVSVHRQGSSRTVFLSIISTFVSLSLLAATTFLDNSEKAP